MRHRLPRLFALVNHQPVATVKLKLLGNLLGRVQKMKMVALIGKESQPRNLLTRHDQNVNRLISRNATTWSSS